MIVKHNVHDEKNKVIVIYLPVIVIVIDYN